MAAIRPTKAKKPAKLRVGDRVRFHHVNRWLVGTIIEDRGLLARGRRQLWRIRVRRREGEDLFAEIPEHELRVA